MRLKISKHPNLAGSTQVPLVPCNMPTKPGSWSIQSSHPTWLLEVIQVTPKIKDGACSYFSSCSPCCNWIAKKAHFRCVHCVHKPKIVSNSSRLTDWQEPPCWAVPSFTKSFHKDRAWNMESMVILWWFGNTFHMQIHRNRSENHEDMIYINWLSESTDICSIPPTCLVLFVCEERLLFRLHNACVIVSSTSSSKRKCLKRLRDLMPGPIWSHCWRKSIWWLVANKLFKLHLLPRYFKQFHTMALLKLL